MTNALIIFLCLLMLLAYAFDITSSRTRIPSVVLLLLLGWAVRQGVDGFGILVPNLGPILPIFGTLGLILIVFEGALELEFNRSKLPLLRKSGLLALLPMVLLAAGIAYAFLWVSGGSFRNALANALPLAVISSAIAIPSAQHLNAQQREFVTYESSLSDILGVIFFNFVTLNDNFGIASVGHFVVELLLLIAISFASSLLLAYLLSRISHHVKYVPIIVMLFLIYAVAKQFHLPALLFILLFGLFLGNLDELKQFRLIRRLQPDVLNREAARLKELTVEITFVVRTLFFLLFGFLIKTSELLNVQTIAWSAGVTAGIFGLRAIFLRLFRLPVTPLLFIAPRGLITILLFLSIPLSQELPVANRSLITQVILLTALVMMGGLIAGKRQETQEETEAIAH